MPLRSFTAEDLDKSDTDLGVLLLAAWIGLQAELVGIDPANVPPEIAERIVAATQPLETDEFRHIALAKAISLSACGEWNRAGALLREIIGDGTFNLQVSKLAEAGRKFRERQKSAGLKGANLRKEESRANRDEWRRIGLELRQRHPNKSDFWLAGQIGKQVGTPTRTIYNSFSELGLPKKTDRKPRVR